MRHCFFLVILVILSGCNYGFSQPTPIPAVTSVESASATPPVQFAQTTSTPTSAKQDPSAQPTKIGNAFENNLPLAARVNNQPLFLDAYRQHLAQFERALIAQGIDTTSDDGQTQINQLQQTVLNGLIDQLIIEQQAQNLGIIVTDADVEAKAQEAVQEAGEQSQNQDQFETWLVNNNLTYQDFVSNLRAQLTAAQVFEHISRDVPKTAEQIWLKIIVTKDGTTAHHLIDALKQGQDFTTLAQEYNSNGNNPGWLPEKSGLIPPEVEKIAFTLQIGEVSGPVQSGSDFYIIKLEGKEADRPLTENMLFTAKNQIFTNWLTEQRQLATIEKFAAP